MIRILACLIIVMGVGTAVLADNDAPATESKPKPDQPAAQPTLDELLGLDSAKPADKPKPADTDTEPVDLSEAQPSDNFMLAVAEMKDAAHRLHALDDPGIGTQRLQESVVRRLDQLISQAKKQQSKSGSGKGKPQDSGSQQNQSKPTQGPPQDGGSQAAQQAGGPGSVMPHDKPDAPLAEQLSEWGNLPPRLRDQVLQGLSDRYSQLYRQMTERYYRRLAEED